MAADSVAGSGVGSAAGSVTGSLVGSGAGSRVDSAWLFPVLPAALVARSRRFGDARAEPGGGRVETPDEVLERLLVWLPEVLVS